MVLSVDKQDVDLGMLAVGLLDEELRLLAVRLEGGLLRLSKQLVGLGAKSCSRAAARASKARLRAVPAAAMSANEIISTLWS